MFLWTIDPDGRNVKATLDGSKLTDYVADTDVHRKSSTFHRAATTNIYKCADGKWFQLHGSLNPDPVLDALGLPHDQKSQNAEQSWATFQKKTCGLTSGELVQRMKNCSQAGDICHTVSEYLQSEQGKANSHVGLFEMFHHPRPAQKKSWWPPSPSTSPERPLAGLKVVDLTRIIAAPAITRGLAEMGASVMRVTSRKIPDFSGLHPDLNWGKWNADLDLNVLEDRDALKRLIMEADVVVNGYRPSVLDKFGLGQEDVLNFVAQRERGIILVRENCYGWYGPSTDRPGWQPVSDAFVGISHGYGKALGLEDGEPVTPLFPTSDYSTGLVGVSAILSALIQRAEKGGSYTIDLALNYYNQWLAQSCGTYPAKVWDTLWARYGRFQFRAENPMEFSAPRVLKMMHEQGCFDDEFFETRHSGILGVNIKCVKAAIQFPNGEVRLQYNVGTRGNGTDAARWPEDLLTEIVK